MSIRLPEGTKLRADVAALRQGKSLSTMVADVVVGAFEAPSPLDAFIAAISGTEYDADAPPLSRRVVLEALQADVAGLAAAVDAELAKAAADHKAFGQALKSAAKRLDKIVESAPIKEPGSNE